MRWSRARGEGLIEVVTGRCRNRLRGDSSMQPLTSRVQLVSRSPPTAASRSGCPCSTTSALPTRPRTAEPPFAPRCATWASARPVSGPGSPSGGPGRSPGCARGLGPPAGSSGLRALVREPEHRVDVGLRECEDDGGAALGGGLVVGLVTAGVGVSEEWRRGWQGGGQGRLPSALTVADTYRTDASAL